MSITPRAARLVPVVAASLLTLVLVWPPGRRDRCDGPPAAVLATGRASRWHVRYPGPDGAVGTPDDIPAGEDLHVPAGRDVTLYLRSDDYLYTFSVPGLCLRGAAVPDLTSSLTIRAPRPGTFAMAADPLCGRRPSRGGRLVVETLPEFEAWLGSIRPPASRP